MNLAQGRGRAAEGSKPTRMTGNTGPGSVAWASAKVLKPPSREGLENQRPSVVVRRMFDLSTMSCTIKMH